MSTHGLTRDGENGAVAVVVAVILILLVSMVALVLDLGLLRIDRRDDQRTADLAANAGALAMVSTDPKTGCERARDYFLENTPGVSGPLSSDPCAVGWSTVPPCSAATSSDESFDIGPYTVRLMSPVSNSFLTSNYDQAVDSSVDGKPCERFFVSVTRERDYGFAGVMGSSQGESLADAVSRGAIIEESKEVSSLVVIDPTGCETLRRTGGGSVHVREVVDNPVTPDDETAPGIITVDSNGQSCSGSNRVIDPNNNPEIRSGGVDGTDTNKKDDNGIIFSFALNGPHAGFAYEPSDVPANLSPDPEPADKRIGRAPIDERYNTDDPDTVDDEAHIDRLETAYGDAGDPMPTDDFDSDLPEPGPFKIYGDDPGENCIVNSNVTLDDDPLATENWYIDCPGNLLINGGTFTIGPGDVVAEGGIKLSGGTLSMNDDGSLPDCDQSYGSSVTDPHILYLRDGDLDVGTTGTKLCLPDILVHLKTGELKLTNADALRWTAPDDDTYPFDDLAMWAESHGEFNMAGQAGVDLEGVWFAPNAGRASPNGDFQFSGGGGSIQTRAQFFTWRFTATGSGTLVMTPDPERNVKTHSFAVRLIR